MYSCIARLNAVGSVITVNKLTTLTVLNHEGISIKINSIHASYELHYHEVTIIIFAGTFSVILA